MLKRTHENSKSKFKFRDTDETVYKERSEQSTGAIGDSIFVKGFDVYRAKEGEHCIRILPRTWEEPRHYGYDIYVHSFVGVNRGTYLCLAQMKNKPCPMCNAANEAAASGEEQEAYKMKAKRRVVYWIVDRNAKKPWPMLFSVSPTMDRDISACTRTKRGQVFIHRPDDGRDVIFKRKGQTLTNTEYFGYQLDTEPTAIHEDGKLQQQMLDFIEENPVPSCLNYQKADYLKMVIEGTIEKDDEDLDDTEADETEADDSYEEAEADNEEEEATEYKTSKAKRAKGKVKAKAAPKDDEDEDDEAEPWNEDDESADDEGADDDDDADSDNEDYSDETDDDEPEEGAKTKKRPPIKSKRGRR